MDSVIETVLREYDQRAAGEMKRMQELPPAEMMKHIDDFLLPVGPATGQLMNILIKESKAKTILEIGTYHGAGALHWAGNAQDAEVYTLDLSSAAAPQLPTTDVDRSFVTGHAETRSMFFEGKPEAARIHSLFGDSATFDFSPFSGKIDLLFIDGAHSYEYVRNDTLRGMKCCNPGSIIAWHDYGRVGFNGVSKWLHEFSQQGKAIYRIPGGSLAYTRL